MNETKKYNSLIEYCLSKKPKDIETLELEISKIKDFDINEIFYTKLGGNFYNFRTILQYFLKTQDKALIKYLFDKYKDVLTPYVDKYNILEITYNHLKNEGYVTENIVQFACHFKDMSFMVNETLDQKSVILSWTLKNAEKFECSKEFVEKLENYLKEVMFDKENEIYQNFEKEIFLITQKIKKLKSDPNFKESSKLDALLLKLEQDLSDINN